MKDLEQLIVLLLGSSPGRIPSAEHLQKEMFVLSHVNPKLVPLLRFEGRCTGPHSARLEEASHGPAHIEDAYAVDADGSMGLTDAGSREYDRMVPDIGYDGGDETQARYADLAAAAGLIRHMYDRLSVDELLFLIHDKYPSYTLVPGMGARYADAGARRRLAESLAKKGIITPGRSRELVAGVY